MADRGKDVEVHPGLKGQGALATPLASWSLVGVGGGDMGLIPLSPPTQLPSLLSESVPPSQRLSLSHFTSRCLAKDSPTFQTKQTHKNSGNFSEKGA